MRSSRVRAVLAAPACALLLAVPVRPVAAAWTDAEYVRVPVQLASSDCSATGLYRAAAASALLAGTVQGVRIADGAATAGVSIGPRTDAATQSTPFTTAAAGATPVVGGTALPLLLTAGGTWGQTARTSGTGASSATVDGTSPLGAIDVSGLLARTPSATSLLPGLSALTLEVGVPAAAASYDACAAGWGATDALGRTSSVGALRLRLQDTGLTTALGGLRSDGAAAATALSSTAAGASAPVAKAMSDALVAALGKALGTGSTAASGSGTATVAPSTSGIAGAVTGTWPVVMSTGGTATVDSDGGSGSVDLLPLLGTAANTEVVTATSAAAAAAALGQGLQQQASTEAAAAATARERAPVTASASATVLAVGTGAATATVTATASGVAADWSAGSIRPAVTVTVTSIANAPVPSGLVDAVTAQLGALPTVGTAISANYLGPARAAPPDATLNDRVTTAAGQLQSHLAALPAVLGVTAAQQAATAATSWSGALTTGVATRTALRIRVKDAAGTRADLFVGNVSVGPDTPLGG